MMKLYSYITGGFNYSDLYVIPEGNMPVLGWYHIICILRGGKYNMYINSSSVQAFDTPTHD